MKEKIEELVGLCKCEVTISINEHRGSYQSIEDWLSCNNIEDDEIAEEVRGKMVAMNRMVGVRFYPNTPIGSYVVYHHDIEAALDEALTIARMLPPRSE